MLPTEPQFVNYLFDGGGKEKVAEHWDCERNCVNGIRMMLRKKGSMK